MPDVSSSGTYTKASSGFDFLDVSNEHRIIYFSGTTVGTSAEVQFKDDQGNWQSVANGTVTDIDSNLYVRIASELQIVFTGSPNCNVTCHFMKNLSR